MANKKLKIEALRDYFKGKSPFNLENIVEFYKTFDDQVKAATVSWRVYELVKQGVLQRVSRGKYKLGKGNNYLPEISPKMKSIYRKVKREFPFIVFCIWNTKWLNEFMLHQPNKFQILLEVEKGTEESVFYFIKESRSEVFLNPNREIFEKYLSEKKEPIMVKSLVSEAPLISEQGIKTVSIEKILVDIFCDEVIFSAYQGSEMLNIFESAFTKYSVNHSKMLRYANRRGKKDELVKFTNSIKQTKYP